MPQFYSLEALECPACGKFFRTPGSRNSHLTQAQSCKWYRRGKIRDLSDEFSTMDQTLFQNSPQDTVESNPIQWEQDTPDFNLDDDEWPDDYNFGRRQTFDFDDPEDDLIPAEPEAGPGPSTQANRARQHQPQSRSLDEEEDERVVIEHPTAGQIKRRSAPPRPVDQEGDTLMESPSDFGPFADELDYNVAEWAVLESIGHSSFDRFLKIPGVSIYNDSLHV